MVKYVRGATVKRDQETGALVVARIMRGGAADRSGLIHEGDELREVNGIVLEDKQLEDIVPIMLFVRALFDYHPQEDEAIPCKEAGLSFRKGDVLQIVSSEEPVWWQARLHGAANARAGLVPSRQFQEREIRCAPGVSQNGFGFPHESGPKVSNGGRGAAWMQADGKIPHRRSSNVD
ncbi:hypothetical protein AAFF_G00022040 [Aldrovandia affinis]|uniref:MAGUK p55 subfamily member 7 n=1 Tax=Aldrovandia affinis TaxID=143900 RepID=A0AAD7WGD6_9TELE|nr:hypothetical protein AAFF_G00022040 [Aldrovandia affinis]